MRNFLFEAVQRETDPMYDAALLTEQEAFYWKNPQCNFCNNGHSSTKFFIASAVGILCDRGLLTPQTTIREVFPFAGKGWENVTVAHALQHKTGMETIPYGVDDDEDQEKIGKDYLGYVLSLPIEYEPGTHYRYSDAAYYLLSRVVAEVSGVNTTEFLRENIMEPLSFRQWAIACCPMGYPIGGGGFYARADDAAKLGLSFACDGRYNGKQIISPDWIRKAMENDYACTQFRDTGIFLKTGAKGQIVAFHPEYRIAAAWHGYSLNDGCPRNDRLLEAFDATIRTL